MKFIDFLPQPPRGPFARNPGEHPSLVLSRFKSAARLMGMNGNGKCYRIWLAAVVLSHLVISIIHGKAHANAQVPLSPAANLFVVGVILGGPLVGLALTWPAQRIGTALIALTMAGSLVFGFVNHFVFDSPDHIAHVDPQWRTLFTITAVLLAITEALGTGLATQVLRRRSI